MDDKTLFHKIRNNDSEAFATLVYRYARALTIFSTRIVNDYQAAEDIVQEVFANIWMKRQKIDPEPSLRNLLYVSVRNQSLKALQAKQRNVSSDNRFMVEHSGYYVIEDEKNRQLSDAIGRLPKRTADVIILTIDGLSQQEIAAEMGITVPTVKLLKSRGIAKLRELLGAGYSWLLFL